MSSFTPTSRIRWRIWSRADVTPDVRRRLIWEPQDGREATIPGPPPPPYLFEGWRLATGPDGGVGGDFVAVLHPTRRITHTLADGSEVTVGGDLRLRLLARWEERGEVWAQLHAAERRRERAERGQREKWAQYADRVGAEARGAAPALDESGEVMSGMMVGMRLLGEVARNMGTDTR